PGTLRALAVRAHIAARLEAQLGRQVEAPPSTSARKCDPGLCRRKYGALPARCWGDAAWTEAPSRPGAATGAAASVRAREEPAGSVRRRAACDDHHVTRERRRRGGDGTAARMLGAQRAEVARSLGGGSVHRGAAGLSASRPPRDDRAGGAVPGDP